MNSPSCGSSTLQGPQVTPKNARWWAGRHANCRMSCQLPRSNGFSCGGASEAGAEIRNESRKCRKKLALHGSSSIVEYDNRPPSSSRIDRSAAVETSKG